MVTITDNSSLIEQDFPGEGELRVSEASSYVHIPAIWQILIKTQNCRD